MIVSRTLGFRTKGNADVIDVTQEVRKEIQKSGIENGIATLWVPGSTAGITTIEYEPGLVKDLKDAFERIAPEGEDYQHNRRWGDMNGHSHIRASILGPSLTVPFIKKELQLGTWQQIVFVDLDNRPRSREVILQIVGE
jgi:secondary thiamine-phosphate synthase enzyme